MTTKRWVARTRGSIADVARDAGADADALSDGRIFIGRERATEVAVGEAGTEITIHERSAVVAVEVIQRTNDLVAVIKPAGIPTIPDHGGREHALLAATARATGLAIEALHPTSRLDRDVSGVVVFAITARGRDELTRAREAGLYTRRYVALATRAPSPESGTWDAPIGRGRAPRLRAVRGREAQTATTRYRTIARAGDRALLAIDPQTGRTHQIRVHASAAGAPLLGDGDYGGPTRLTLPGGRSQTLHRVYLHCAKVVIGLDGGPSTLLAPIPAELQSLWATLEGADSAWADALSASVTEQA
ncbi:RluA family pseudouridine synthase [soil metagenome]